MYKLVPNFNFPTK